MKLFKRSGEPPSGSENHVISQEKTDVLMRTVISLFDLLKIFALEISEIQSERYKQTIDELIDLFRSTEKPKRIELDYERQRADLLTFIERQNHYLLDRERELRDIIDLLTKAMANLNVENLEFYQRVYDQSEKIIEITNLDDIKKIKNALKQEVDRMRESVDIKRDQENRRMQLLSGQVEALRHELEKAKNKSLTDGLTGVYNRQAFDDDIGNRVEQSEAMNQEFALLMLDLDDFKVINDTYGHLIGDRVLVAFAQKCRSAIRGDDFIARYGGEEFAIVLNGANLRNALVKARQICDNVASVRYATSENQKDGYLAMTVSIGVTAFRKGDTPETLIARADKALYDAKKAGKNRAMAQKS